ncbi:acetyltransferase [Paenibacillus radicis (ex Gao et al. 2016)]|uniref:Hexapeptide transferase n=1 Tax=Paenibacillus radicis (ex Gao et al. 2016) TaxID=1737354 RepID=A0A917H0X8_9BACL|nr:acetyltransferase [Paenibacillus radicis (ex Gao et al. 2016)]GGG63314.1 hexapeptide transferase [Paenibacillus radicis (ex Gao et al. 2016)]
MQRDKVVIIGGGGHAKVIIDILNSSNRYDIVGFTSQSNHQQNLCGVQYLGDDSILSSLMLEGIKYCSIAIGDNKIRKKLFDKLVKEGFTPINAISPSAYVSSSARIGNGVVIMPGAVVNASAIIEDNVIINTLTGIDHDCTISAHSHIAPGVSLAGGVFVGEGTFIGVGSSVIPEVKIGEWTVIGAGSAVVNDISSHVTVVGVPAKKYI